MKNAKYSIKENLKIAGVNCVHWSRGARRPARPLNPLVIFLLLLNYQRSGIMAFKNSLKEVFF